MKIQDFKISECFACMGNEFQKDLALKDYFLSGEEFSLIKCSMCGLLYTWPVPGPDTIETYYESKDYISHNARSFSLETFIYRQARFFALKNKLAMIRKYVKQGLILDIGAGTGEFLNHCKKNGWQVYGIEPNAAARKIAFDLYGIQLMEPELTDNYEKEHCDVITMWHVLEHVYDPLHQLNLNHSLLKPGGLLVLALPDHNSWDAQHYGKFWAAWDVPRHLFHFTEESIKFLAQRSGFHMLEKHPLKLDAYYISLLSEKYVHGKTNFIKAFFKGYQSNLLAKKGNFGYSSQVYLLQRK